MPRTPRKDENWLHKAVLLVERIFKGSRLPVSCFLTKGMRARTHARAHTFNYQVINWLAGKL